MNNRTKATSIPKKVREEVYARDKGCLEIKEKVRQYLERLYPDFTDEMRIYDKWRSK